MSKVQRSRWVLPTTVNPPTTRCFQIEIPDDPLYIAAFKGALYDLSKPYAWQNDPFHIALEAGARMFTAYLSIQEVTCGGNMLIRACTSNCGIEYSTDGGATWTCIDLTGCISTIWDEKLAGAFNDGVLGKGVNQQGPQPRPTVGHCDLYHVKLNANDIWHCPNPITSGMTIQVSAATGGWSDGTLAWYCPDGARYLAGACSEVLKTHETGDPLASAYHMAIVGNFGSTWFDPLTALYTVPNSTSLQEFFIQANDGSLSDNKGSIEFNVEVCTTSESGWCYEYDFTTGQHGWDISTCGTSATYGSYVTGNGFMTEIHSNYCTAEIHIALPIGATWDFVQYEYSNLNATSGEMGIITIAGGHCTGHGTVSIATGDTISEMGANGVGTDNEFFVNFYTNSGYGPIYLHKIRFMGNPGTNNVFPESNC